ncbi:MAG: hypothetical protein IAF94_16370 [Pirellulaceae bacterium]|nr:hypothetical protein [Pirellulaceae bacterium]
MLCRSSYLAVGPALLLAAAVLAGEPIFDARPGHPWDQAREIFYVRRFPTGEVYEHPHAFAPPWNEFIPFTRDAAFYEQVLSRLEAVEELPPAQMEEQAASRRVIFLRDLWAVFDGLRYAHHSWPPDEDKAASAKAAIRRDELLRLLARIMQRLELTEEEVRALPHAFQTLGEKKRYPTSFDPSSESEPFFPADLLDNDGPWVTYSSEPEPSAGGLNHMDSVRHRSVFTLHLRTPDGRDGGAKFLADFTEAEGRQAVPPGTTLALLRRALVPTRSEKLLVSPLVESLQLIAVTPLEDQRFKFTLDRKEFLTGGAGMKLLGKDDPVDTSSFESFIIQSRIMSTVPREPGPPSESLIAGQYKTLREIPSSLGICAECHSMATRSQIFGRGLNNAPKAAYLQSDPDKAAATIVKKKEASVEWKTYLRLRTSQAR